MSPEQLTAWRSRMGWNVSEAARQLDLSRNGYAAYERGYVEGEPIAGTPLLRYRNPRPIPRHIELACERLEQLYVTL